MSEQKEKAYPCFLCRRDLLNLHRIRCCICIDMEFCIPCFREMPVIDSHRPTHKATLVPGYIKAFIVPSPKNLPSNPLKADSSYLNHTEIEKTTSDLLSSWTFDEERLLLEFLRRCGIGNYEELLKRLEHKTEEEVEKYLFYRFFHSSFKALNGNLLNLCEEKLEKSNKKFLQRLPKKLIEKQDEYGFLPYRLEMATEPYKDAEFLIKDIGKDEAEKKVIQQFASGEMKKEGLEKPAETVEVKIVTEGKKRKLEKEIRINEEFKIIVDKIKTYNRILVMRNKIKIMVFNDHDSEERKKELEEHKKLQRVRKFFPSSFQFISFCKDLDKIKNKKNDIVTFLERNSEKKISVTKNQNIGEILSTVPDWKQEEVEKILMKIEEMKRKQILIEEDEMGKLTIQKPNKWDIEVQIRTK